MSTATHHSAGCPWAPQPDDEAFVSRQAAEGWARKVTAEQEDEILAIWAPADASGVNPLLGLAFEGQLWLPERGR